MELDCPELIQTDLGCTHPLFDVQAIHSEVGCPALMQIGLGAEHPVEAVQGTNLLVVVVVGVGLVVVPRVVVGVAVVVVVAAVAFKLHDEKNGFQIQSPLHHAAPLPPGQTRQFAARWPPQITRQAWHLPPQSIPVSN